MAEREMTSDQLAKYNSQHGTDPELEKKSYKNDECFENTPWLDRMIKADARKASLPMSKFMSDLIDQTMKEFYGNKTTDK